MELKEIAPELANVTVDSFTIRVYGILIDAQKRVLLSDEFIRGDYFTKFPGGGLEFGEGTRDCLKREFKEETGLDVKIGDHIYTTDYYQISAFNKSNQIIAIYYYAHAVEPVNVFAKITPFDFAPEQVSDPAGQSEVLRWVTWEDLTQDTVSLPIDKIVVGMIKA
jgi:8-oxo-dGTP pyrophosphatase MutT (NUDIX family)